MFGSTALVFDKSVDFCTEEKSSRALLQKSDNNYLLNPVLNDSTLATRIRAIQAKLTLKKSKSNTHEYDLKILENPIITLDDVEKEFISLNEISKEDSWKQFNEEEKLAIEKYKLAIMQATQAHLRAAYPTCPKQAPVKTPKKVSKLRWIVFGAFLILELAPMIWGSFVGMGELMEVFPGLALEAIMAINIAICGIETVVYYSVMGPLLKEALGIPIAESTKPRMETYGQQLEALQDIDKIMTLDNKMKADDYARYAKLATLFNNHIIDLQESKTKFEKFNGHPVKKVIQGFLAVLNIILNIGGGYFWALSLLNGMSSTAVLVGTPIGWGIVALVIFGQLALRFAVRSNTMFNMLNPGALKHEEIREQVMGSTLNSKKYDDIWQEKKRIEELEQKCIRLEKKLIEQQFVPSAESIRGENPVDRNRTNQSVETGAILSSVSMWVNPDSNGISPVTASPPVLPSIGVVA